MYRRGFTIIELIIVIAVMAILLALGIVNLTSSQISSRDSARKTDVDNIALSLETIYNSGNSDQSISPGSYPSTALSDSSNATIATTLRDIDPTVLVAPGISDQTTKSFISATNNTQTTAGVAPQPDINHFVYQPLQSDGTLCNSSSMTCRRFNIYYMLEADNSVHMITSKNQ